jgi:hypothetical protein
MDAATRFNFPSRGDKTAIELFLAGTQGLPATIRVMLCQPAAG